MRNLVIIIFFLLFSQQLLAQINIYNLKHLGRPDGVSGSLVFNNEDVRIPDRSISVYHFLIISGGREDS